MPGGRIGEKCISELILKCVWENGWDFKSQSFMAENCNLEACPQSISPCRRRELPNLQPTFSKDVFACTVSDIRVCCSRDGCRGVCVPVMISIQSHQVLDIFQLSNRVISISNKTLNQINSSLLYMKVYILKGPYQQLQQKESDTGALRKS